MLGFLASAQPTAMSDRTTKAAKMRIEEGSKDLGVIEIMEYTREDLATYENL